MNHYMFEGGGIEMDVIFKRAISMGRGYDRYIPILIHKTDDINYQMLIEESEDVSFDLNAISDDKFWDAFLEYYNLVHYYEGIEGNSIKLYQLKPSVELNFPKNVVLGWGTTQNIKVDETGEETLLLSSPAGGRSKEFIITQGTVEFNQGQLFHPHWKTIKLS